MQMNLTTATAAAPYHHLLPSSTTLPFLSTSSFSKPLNNNNNNLFSPTHPQAVPAKSSSSPPLSLPLHSKNPHIIARDIARLARLGKLKQSLTILDYAEHAGIPIPATAFSALISACGRARSLSFLRHAHAHLRVHSLTSNPFLSSKLAEAYSACSAFSLARSVINELSCDTCVDAFQWNSIIKGSLTAGNRRGLEEEHNSPVFIFNEMRERCVSPNEYTFSCVIKSIAGSRNLVEGEKMHALVIKSGISESSALIKTGLVDMYFKFGKVRLALKVFDELPERDVVAWGTVIAGFAHKSLRKEAVECVRRLATEGIEINSVVVTSVLPVIGELKHYNIGREIHAYVLKKFRDFSGLASVRSGLVDMYCKCGDMVSGRHVFYGSKKRNIVLWTALMSGYASNGRLEQALRSMIWMQQEGIKPDAVAIATVLPVSAKLKALKQGKEIHAYALKSWFLPNISISTSLMTMYAACGFLNTSCKVFDAMTKKNVIAWTALIESYLVNKHLYGALDVFRSMHSADYRTDAVAIGRVLSIAGALKSIKLGKEIQGQILKKKLASIPFVTTEVITMYGKCGDIKKAQAVFDSVQSKGSLTWTAIIQAYGFNGRYGEALHLFDLMLSSGYIPNHFTFDAVLNVCLLAGWPDIALRIFDSMVIEHNLIAFEEHYNSIISLLYQVGRVEEAQRFVQLKSAVVLQ